MSFEDVRTLVAEHRGAGCAEPDRALVGLYFRGITPNGLVLYDKLDEYRFVDLRMTFPAQAVSQPAISEFPPPAVFFADR